MNNTLRKILGFFIVLSVTACTTVEPVVITDTQCPFPPSLATTKKDNTYKFLVEASGITATGLGAKANVDIGKKLEENFAAADDVNKLYAISYVGCVTCRISHIDGKECLNTYTQLYNQVTAKSGPGLSVEDKVRRELVEDYKSKFLR